MKIIALILKGIGIGIANVIPGVSGGTIALITGIFERLINSIKSFDIKALKLLFAGKIKDFIEYTDLKFLFSVLFGVLIAVVSIAKLFEYLFLVYPVSIWSYFFGLVVASVYFVGKTVSKWKFSVILTFIIGTVGAVMLSLLNPATESSNFFYLLICGAVAICSMILPGLSGSFILILMGNYKLVVIDAVNNMDIGILIPVMIGAGVGLLGFSHFLSWIFKKYKDETISILTGFILGSISILWPWKHELYMLNETGVNIMKDGEPIIIGYERYIPESLSLEVIIAIGLMILGYVCIWLLEKTAESKV